MYMYIEGPTLGDVWFAEPFCGYREWMKKRVRLSSPTQKK